MYILSKLAYSNNINKPNKRKIHMINRKVATLARNLKNNKNVREQSVSLIRELAGVASNVSSGNHSFRLQKLISRTTLGFSTAVALRSLIEIIIENTREEEYEPPVDLFFVRVFSNDNLFNAVSEHIKVNYTSKIKVDSNVEPEIVFQSLNLRDYIDTEEEELSVKNLSKSLQTSLEGAPENRGVYVYVEPFTQVETYMNIGGFQIQAEYVERQPIPPQNKSGNGTTADLWGQEGLKMPEPIGTRRGSRSTKDSTKLEKKLQQFDSYLFKCYSLEEREAVQKFLLELGPKAYYIGNGDEESTYRGSSDIYVADKKGEGEWSSIPMRTADTVILPEGLFEEIVREIKTFTTYEQIYGMLGVPYHHGIMLHGSPGTGKSSAAQAIAASFRRQVYSASLGIFENDDAFVKFIRRVNSNSIVLLEDVDCAKAAVSREENQNGVSMETLLNVLDGVLSPHGCIFILTTNHPENIGEAVVRPGRVDATYSITYLVDEQFERLCRKFMRLKDDVELNLPSVEGLNITPAEIVGEIKKFIPNIADALPQVIAYVEEKRAKLLEDDKVPATV